MPDPELNQELKPIVAKFLHYSFRDINYEYAGLTNTEKRLITPTQFEDLVSWVKKYPAQTA